MKVAFLDRDGTLVYEPPLTKHVTVEDFRILPGAIEGLQKLRNEGYALVIVSNQAAAPRYDIREHNFWATQKRLEEELAKHDIQFDAVFVCLHLPIDHCPCRKPKTGMVDDFL